MARRLEEVVLEEAIRVPVSPPRVVAPEAPAVVGKAAPYVLGAAAGSLTGTKPAPYVLGAAVGSLTGTKPAPHVLGPAAGSVTGVKQVPAEAAASVYAGGAQGAVAGRVVLTESAAAPPAGTSRGTVLLAAAGLGVAALVLALR